MFFFFGELEVFSDSTLFSVFSTAGVGDDTVSVGADFCAFCGM